MIFKNWQSLFRDKTNDQEQCLSASIWKKEMKKDVQTLEHSSHNEGVVIWAENANRSILVSINWLITLIITTETTIRLIHGTCGSVRVSTKVLIKQLVGERKYSRKYDNTLRAYIYWSNRAVRHSLPYCLLLSLLMRFKGAHNHFDSTWHKLYNGMVFIVIYMSLSLAKNYKSCS